VVAVKKSFKIFLTALVIALFFGFLDGLVTFYLFSNEHQTLLDALFFNVSAHSFYNRIVLIIALLLAGFFIGRSMQKSEELKIRTMQQKFQECALDSEAVQQKINAIIPITRSDRQGVITFANEAYARLTGYSIEELMGQKHNILRHPMTPESYYKKLWRTIARGDIWEGELKNVKKNGDEFYTYTHIMPEYDDRGKRKGYIAIRSNITEVKALEKMALHDALTGLFNRREFDRRIAWQVEESMRYGTALSLIYADMDFFKQINDKYGHFVGDEVLKTFAELVAERLRKSDSFARIGGEEFAVILPHTQLHHARRIAEELRSAVEGMSVPEVGALSASFGVVQLARTDTVESLLRRADKALYRSKHEGRNRVTALPA
jgi:diguanylate cyclase (GGDEF)-like protein/PAS domain S-box-containing protein